jgi:(S)-ureidoglycine aminohydrolase
MKIVCIIALSFFTLTTMAQLQFVNGGVFKWNELPVKVNGDRESRKILEGTSTHLDYFEMHATTQFKGAKPSTAHANDDIEECLIVKEGKMKATIEGKSTELGPGGVILLMPKQMHSVENAGDGNLTYYVMRFKSKKKMEVERGVANGGTLTLNKDSLKFTTNAKGGRWDYFDRPTAMCERFEMHITQLDKKEESHAPHKHLETEIILIISGETEMTLDGKEYKASAGDFYLMNSDLMHGIRNSLDTPCVYFAFKWK